MDNANFCTYCSAVFGTMVLYKGKLHILQRQKEHFTPRSKNGIDEDINITPSCQICNMIKFTKDFNTGTEAQLFILDKLLRSDWRIVRGPGEGLPPSVSARPLDPQRPPTEARRPPQPQPKRPVRPAPQAPPARPINVPEVKLKVIKKVRRRFKVNTSLCLYCKRKPKMKGSDFCSPYHQKIIEVILNDGEYGKIKRLVMKAIK